MIKVNAKRMLIQSLLLLSVFSWQVSFAKQNGETSVFFIPEPEKKPEKIPKPFRDRPGEITLKLNTNMSDSTFQNQNITFFDYFEIENPKTDFALLRVKKIETTMKAVGEQKAEVYLVDSSNNIIGRTEVGDAYKSILYDSRPGDDPYFIRINGKVSLNRVQITFDRLRERRFMPERVAVKDLFAGKVLATNSEITNNDEKAEIFREIYRGYDFFTAKARLSPDTKKITLWMSKPNTIIESIHYYVGGRWVKKRRDRFRLLAKREIRDFVPKGARAVHIQFQSQVSGRKEFKIFEYNKR